MPAKVKLEVLNGTWRGTAFVFRNPDECTVGRAPDCKIRFSLEREYIGVARHHCIFDINPPDIYLRDLDSTTGTFINERPVGSAKDVLNVVRNGDLVRAGPLLLAVEVNDDSTESEQTSLFE